ncbi:class I SAM-dependent methyltransferase [Neiella sp. HB171785]|uniref:Class I SAM-dependent methyltransferase n=1 Tax=Neiella litorisoli TaxID=2771431 RepID=A0A8J6QU61_9GAMM|nr:class I SAM-dependent methyltransferase [Neiella litorisoli]MBD1388603.1 class I SAM-dependent methyltransferase [Neiella litorisoli]
MLLRALRTTAALKTVLAGLTLSAAVIATPSLADDALAKSIADERRGAMAQRDVYRHPYETLTFFGIKPTDTVIELWPGSGAWYSSILAPYLKAEGKFIAANFKVTDVDENSYYYKSGSKFLSKLDSNKDWWGDVAVVEFQPPATTNLGADNSVDMVLTFRNLHGWHRDGFEADVLAAAFAVLKPGGVLGVVQHRGPDNKTNEQLKGSGYLNQAELIGVIERAGFKLDATSEVNANAKDTKDHPKGVWTLPPVLRLKDQDKAKYMAIGESDRMTLKFIKPAK